jgi:hypothetical protein
MGSFNVLSDHSQPVAALALLVLSLLLASGCGSYAPTTTEARLATPPKTTPTATPKPAAAVAQTTDKSLPDPNGKPAFTINGKTEHGDTIHAIGRFGPILLPSQSDVDQTALHKCPDSNDGRELVRRLDITVSLTSSLSGAVGISGFTVSSLSEEGPDTHLLLDYVLPTSDGTSCFRDTGEEGSTGIANLGTLQPHTSAHVTAWVVLPDAITPSDLHPTAAKLAHEGWYIGYPDITVNGYLALTDHRDLSVTE